MFHVDPKADTQGSLNTSDDVIVTTQGNVGIGVLPESAADTLSLRLTDGGTPTLPRSPLRIEDGAQREGRVLTSNAGGYATWKDLSGDFTPGRVYGFQGVSAISLPVGSALSVFTFTADVAGQYLFEICWWGKFKGRVALPFILFQLQKNSTLVDSFEQYPGANTNDSNVCSLFFTLYGEALTAGETFRLVVTPSSMNTNSTFKDGSGQDTQTTPAWAQAKVNVLRVN
jgi:hypothetical protein